MITWRRLYKNFVFVAFVCFVAFVVLARLPLQA
jgi:hypothetical protein